MPCNALESPVRLGARAGRVIVCPARRDGLTAHFREAEMVQIIPLLMAKEKSPVGAPLDRSRGGYKKSEEIQGFELD